MNSTLEVDLIRGRSISSVLSFAGFAGGENNLVSGV